MHLLHGPIRERMVNKAPGADHRHNMDGDQQFFWVVMSLP
ncbi:hypothetical protein SUS17_1649 [Sphingomonas sp. S17]|nr:hypothetical protein SUS17_1649 [Sphingomonas sp. S17]